MNELGDGPKRFALTKERPLAEQLADLTPEQKACFEKLKADWSAKNNKNDAPPFSDAMILRFARNSPGRTKFNARTAFKVMKRFDQRYLELTAEGLAAQLQTKTLFPVPGLQTKEGKHAFFYMRPSRYVPSQMPVPDVIDNLAYSMNHLVEFEKECTEGIAFLAYMNEYVVDVCWLLCYACRCCRRHCMRSFLV
jgi:hypothetical protein